MFQLQNLCHTDGLPGPEACREQAAHCAYPKVPAGPVLLPWFWGLHLSSVLASCPLPTWGVIVSLLLTAPLEKSPIVIASPMTHTFDGLRIQTCPSDSSHQNLETLQMLHRPSISTWKAPTVPQMWSPRSVSQRRVTTLHSVIPPAAPVVSHLPDPAAPAS